MKSIAAILAAGLALPGIAQDKPFAIAIHGGSGAITRASLTPEREAAYRTVLGDALEAGRIVLERSGNVVFSFTTEGMYRGFARGAQKPEILIYR